MTTNQNEYHFNLFKPTTEHGRKNRNIIITMVLIWFISVFGFQMLLVILQKPTPEKAYTTFESVWDKIKNSSATETEQQDYIRSLISIYGKSTVKKEHRQFLKNGISSVVYLMVSDSEKVILSSHIGNLNTMREKLTSAKDEEYVNLQASLAETKKAINDLLDSQLAIIPGSVEAALLPYTLNDKGESLRNEDMDQLPGIMKLYLMHNQSVLTDFKFLGFPFHYFYTAEFLLILFVLLCLIYSIRIEKLDQQYLKTEN